MDLDSTLIKAEALFRRYQRLVEAVDKKQNFPAPRSANARSPQASPSPTKSGKGKAADEEPERVITPELRKLLSRNVEVLPRQTVAQKGDGMPSR